MFDSPSFCLFNVTRRDSNESSYWPENGGVFMGSGIQGLITRDHLKPEGEFGNRGEVRGIRKLDFGNILLNISPDFILLRDEAYGK